VGNLEGLNDDILGCHCVADQHGDADGDDGRDEREK
jgi:hypothetical protein